MAEKNEQQKQTKAVPKSELTGNLKGTLNEIAFRNEQVKQIMSEELALKNKLGNRGKNANRRQAGASSLSGLSGLGSAPTLPSGYTKRGR
jgi:hypothetical protein